MAARTRAATAEVKRENTVTGEYDRSQPPPCPMCCSGGSKKKLAKPFPKIDFARCKVRVGDRFVDYEATKDYVTNNFPHLETETYKVPAAFSYFHKEGSTNYDFKRDDELNTKQEITEVLIDRRQKEAVEVVASAIFRWGKKKSEPMFVISEYKFTNFLGNMYMRDDAKNKNEKVIKQKKINLGDHDIFVIMKRGLLVFVQVKGVAGSSGFSTKRGKLREALEQASKDKIVVQDINKDLPFVTNLRMVGLAAVPNLTDSHLREVNVCSLHKEETLTGCLFWNEESFDEWWEGKLGDAPPSGMTQNQYTDLLRKYVGLGSIVQHRTAADAIHKTASGLSGHGTLKLNQEQQDVLNDKNENHKKKVLLGDFGTGKSLLLVQMANQLAERGDDVYLISFSVVSDGSGKVFEEYDNCVEHLQEMTDKVVEGKKLRDERSRKGTKKETAKVMDDQEGDDEDERGSIKVKSFYEQFTEVGLEATSKFRAQTETLPFNLSPEILKEVMENSVTLNDKNIHFFLDEVPLCIGERGWEEFERFCHAHPNMYVWISIAVCSYALEKHESYRSLDCYLPESFRKSSLTRCMRMPRHGFNLVSAVRKFKEDGHHKISVCGTVKDGLKPKWCELPPCSCKAADPLYDCKCTGKERIRDILERIIERELYGETSKKIVIILHDTVKEMTRFLGNAVDAACRELDIPYEYKGSKSGTPHKNTRLDVGGDLGTGQFKDDSPLEEGVLNCSSNLTQFDGPNATVDSMVIGSCPPSAVVDKRGESLSEHASSITGTNPDDRSRGMDVVSGNTDISDPPSAPRDHSTPTVTCSNTGSTDESASNGSDVNIDSRGARGDLKVTLVDFWSYKGSESSVVIYLDPYGGPIVRTITSRWAGYQDVAGTLARSLAQIFYITWPQNEQESFLQDFLGRVREYGSDEKSRQFWAGIAKQAERKDGKGSFMDFLISGGVISKL